MLSERIRNLGTENAFVVLKEVNDLKRQGYDIINFCIGQPDFDTPENIKKAAKKAMDEGKVASYTPSSGLYELREVIAESQKKRKHIEVNPEDIVVACGGKPFIGFSILALTDYGKGDEVIIPAPSYPIYESQTILNGAKPVYIPLLEEKGFNFDLEDLKNAISKKTKMLFLCSPHNPTGTILSNETLKGVADLAVDHDFYVYADEVYSGLVFNGTFYSIQSIDGMLERTIAVDCVSKTYAMPGWRLGYAVNREFAPYLTKLVTNFESCAPAISQYAAIEAISGSQEEAKKMAESFKERADLIVRLLNEIPGFKCIKPQGAFYAFPNVTEACKMLSLKSSEELRKRLLNEAHVALLSDIHFGKKIDQKNQYLRLSFASSVKDLKEGAKRIKDFMEKNLK